MAGGEDVSEGIMDCGGNRVVGVCRGRGDKRQVRGWDTAYQMTGLPTAGDDLSKKPLISGQALGLHSPLIRACCCQWLTPTPVHSGCRAEDRQQQTSLY